MLKNVTRLTEGNQYKSSLSLCHLKNESKERKMSETIAGVSEF